VNAVDQDGRDGTDSLELDCQPQHGYFYMSEVQSEQVRNQTDMYESE
jgi:hypothetical protein